MFFKCGVVKNWILWSFRDIKLCLSRICWIFFDWCNKGGETKWFWSFPKVIWESGVILSQFSSHPGRKNICYFILLITWKQSLSNSTQTYKLDLTSIPFPAPYVKLFCPFPWPWSTLQLMIKTKGNANILAN